MIDNDNDGIRTIAIKFLETVVMLQTHPDEDSMKRENDFSLDDVPLTIKIVRRRKLEDEAIRIFDILLKFHAASHISSVNLIACTGTLCTIAKLRPSLMSPVIDNLKYLHSNLPPTLTNSQVASVKKTLKMQFINLLKHPASFEHHTAISEILLDLGASKSEIAKAIPKLDQKEMQRRAKRVAEPTTHPFFAKKAKLEEEKIAKREKIKMQEKLMDVDVDEYKVQLARANSQNEQFVQDNLKNVEMTAQIVMASMPQLPDDCPDYFLKGYSPVVNLTIPQQIQKLSKQLAPLLTEKKLGPGAKEITTEPPSIQQEINIGEVEKMSLRKEKDPEILQEMEIDEEEDDDDVEEVPLVDDAASKLRKTLERMKGEQAMPKLKQRVKTLKFEEITKPLHKELKTKFLLDSVRRILKAERPAIMGGVAFKRKKIIVVLASTFMPSVRQIIMDYLFEDIARRFDLAFMWLFEEYSMLQGFTRHSYVKTEHKHDYAYNLLLTDLLKFILEKENFREKESLLKRLYLEAPLITEEAFDMLYKMCEDEKLSECGLVLIKDLLIRRPPKELKLLQVLLRFTHHKLENLREKSLENVICVFSLHKLMPDKIEDYAVTWLNFLEKETPGKEFRKAVADEELGDLKSWNEDLVKLCLSLFLEILPHKEGKMNLKIFHLELILKRQILADLIHQLCKVYVASTSDVKRIFLRAVEVPIRKIGQQSKEFLSVIETCAGGSDAARPLIMKFLGIVTEKSKKFFQKLILL